jgi:ATP/maltotriose-dependent transcriptional regulator MalT
MWRLCRGQECGELSDRAVTALEPFGATPELARAYAQRAGVYANRGQTAEALDVARRAQRLAEELALPDVLSDALNTEAVLAQVTGGTWEPLIERAIEVALSVGEVAQAGRGYANLQAMLLSECRLSQAESVYRVGAALCERADVSTYGYCLAGGQAETLLESGRFAEAEALAVELLNGPPMSAANRIGVWTTIGLVQARRGDFVSAAPLFEQARTFTDSTGEDAWIAEIYPRLAEWAWLRNDIETARRDIVRAVQHCEGDGAWIAGAAMAWASRLGLEPATPSDLPTPYRLQAEGDHAAAVEAWERLGNPYRAALALYDTKTEDGLREALGRFEGLGAAAAAEVTRRAMKEMGIKAVPVGPRSATRGHPVGLTPREQEVLELVCAGQTNLEISKVLTISPRTVDHHVAALLEKLGVPTRTAAAAEAARLGLAGPEPRKIGMAAAKSG